MLAPCVDVDSPPKVASATWEEILFRVQRLWCQSRQQFRDVRIEVGRLLAEYLLARLKTADDMTLSQRYHHQNTRQMIIRHAAKVLEVRDYTVNELIRTWHAVHLLSDNGDVGDLTYSCLTCFSRLIDFKRGKVKRSSGTGDLKPSEREAWKVRHPVEANVEMFRKAVAEHWTVDRARVAVLGRPSDKLRPRNDREPDTSGKPTVLAVRGMVANATAKDAVDILYEMVLASPDPVRVVTELAERIRSRSR